MCHCGASSFTTTVPHRSASIHALRLYILKLKPKRVKECQGECNGDVTPTIGILSVVIKAIRRVLAIVAACGLAASVVTYIESYVGTTMDTLSRSAILLHLGVFVLILTMYARDHSAVKDRTFFWKGFSQGRPKWVVPTIKLLGLFFVVHFVLFLVQSHAASPEIRGGQYVLNNHGRIVKVLTQSEYISIKGAELRLFATGWMFFYFVPTADWWFPRKR